MLCAREVRKCIRDIQLRTRNTAAPAAPAATRGRRREQIRPQRDHRTFGIRHPIRENERESISLRDRQASDAACRHDTVLPDRPIFGRPWFNIVHALDIEAEVQVVRERKGDEPRCLRGFEHTDAQIIAWRIVLRECVFYVGGIRDGAITWHLNSERFVRIRRQRREPDTERDDTETYVFFHGEEINNPFHTSIRLDRPLVIRCSRHRWWQRRHSRRESSTCRRRSSAR